MVKVELVEYLGLKDCVRISNEDIELIITTQIGPRVIRYGYIGGPNEFCELEDQIKYVDPDKWMIFGGHRLWHSPEADPRSVIPDGKPVQYRLMENGVELSQNIEEITNIKKEMVITMSDYGSVTINHKLTNKGIWPVKLAPWALTVMAPGGVEIMPMNDEKTGLLPNRTFTLWPYSKMDDDRVKWGDKYMFIYQYYGHPGAFKMGYPNKKGWAAYFNHNNLFLKRYNHLDKKEYPDFHCSYETYVCDYMLEMETLGALEEIEPNESVEHEESWELFRDISAPYNEDEVEGKIEQII